MTSDFSFRIKNMGVTYDFDAKINPSKHETLEEIYATIRHEDIHVCFNKIFKKRVPAHKKQHWVIKIISFGKETLC